MLFYQINPNLFANSQNSPLIRFNKSTEIMFDKICFVFTLVGLIVLVKTSPTRCHILVSNIISLNWNDVDIFIYNNIGVDIVRKLWNLFKLKSKYNRCNEMKKCKGWRWTREWVWRGKWKERERESRRKMATGERATIVKRHQWRLQSVKYDWYSLSSLTLLTLTFARVTLSARPTSLEGERSWNAVNVSWNEKWWVDSESGCVLLLLICILMRLYFDCDYILIYSRIYFKIASIVTLFDLPSFIREANWSDQLSRG